MSSASTRLRHERHHRIAGLNPGFGYRMPMFSWLKKIFSGKPDASQEPPPAGPGDDDAPTVSDPVVGYYVDPRTTNLPNDILVGHGFLLVQDLLCERLLLDGVDVGDPGPHPHHQGRFLGFFNVPPGAHTVVLEHQGRRCEWTLELAPNTTQVRRCDWERGGLVEADADSQQLLRDQARSGESLRAGALRPWPLASVFIQGAPEQVAIDGNPVPAEATRAFFGVTGFAAGAHQVRLGDATVALKLPAEGRVLLSCGLGGAEVQDGKTATMLIKVLMMHAPREALWPLSALVPIPSPPVVTPVVTPDPAPQASGPRSFNDADLEQLRATFARLQSNYDEPTITEYVEILRAHYIQDREMAAQSDYFIRYTGELQLQVEALPRITASQAMTHLRYLSEDLQDTGVSALATLGRKLSAALDKASAS